MFMLYEFMCSWQKSVNCSNNKIKIQQDIFDKNACKNKCSFGCLTTAIICEIK